MNKLDITLLFARLSHQSRSRAADEVDLVVHRILRATRRPSEGPADTPKKDGSKSTRRARP